MHKMLTRLHCFLSSALAELLRQKGSHERPCARRHSSAKADDKKQWSRVSILCIYTGYLKRYNFSLDEIGAPILVTIHFYCTH